MAIHPTAVVHPSAEISPDAEIGPFCFIGPKTKIGPGTQLISHVTILSNCVLGADSVIHPGAVLGGQPQDRKYSGEDTLLIIGDRSHIREFVTIHRATGPDEQTIIGDDNLLMAYCHIGHNCKVGHRVMIANNSGVSGHVIIGDDANIGGFVGVHQYVRVGRLAMLGGYSKVVRDVPPFSLVDGRPAVVRGTNVTGLKRQQISPQVREDLKQAFKILYRSRLNVSQAVARIEVEIPPSPELEDLLEFLADVRKGYGGRARDPRGEAA